MVKCDICHFNNPDGFAYCGRCGNGLSGRDVPDETFISSALEGERKQATIIFADISGFTALNDAAQTPDEVERALQIVNQCLQLLSEVVYEYDGYIDKYMGDAIMAVFGAPRSHEDDPERALRTALTMRERLDEFNRSGPFNLKEPLGIHLGINTGTVIAGLVGTNRKRAYTVMGDVVNVASRLEGVSERGEILVNYDTYNLTNRLFIFKEREPVLVKGKKEPLTIYELIGAKSQDATQRGIAGFRSPMVGRSNQFAELKKQLAQLKAGQGGITVVTGEAGLGKSRLVSELEQFNRRNNGNILWLEGRGLSYRQNVSYKLFVEILRKYLGVGPDEPGEVVWLKWRSIGPQLFGERETQVTPYLAALMGIKLDEQILQTMPLSDPQLLRQRMFVAVGEWVEAIVARQAAILVFEDLHWADSASVALIRYLMTITQYLPLRLICVSRPDREIDFWKIKTEAAREYTSIYTEFSLEPLTKSQSRSLVDQLLHVDQLPQTLERLILSRSEGNPLFMEEVLRSLIEDGSLVKEGSDWVMARPVTDIVIPDTLTGVLTSRIDRLDEPVKRILQIASVIGRVFPYSVLAAVSSDVAASPAELDDYLAHLITAELIREHESAAPTEKEYIFKHILTHETTYNTLLLQQRRNYHKRIADHMAPMYYLKGEEYASIVAHHYELGAVWDRALTYQLRAAEASRVTFDNVNAVAFYTKALHTSELISELKTESLIKIHEGRGQILKRLGRLEEARLDFEETLKLAKSENNLNTQMKALSELGNLHASHQYFSQAAPYFEQALAIARQLQDELGLVDVLNQLGEFSFNMGQLDESNRYFHEALDIAQSVNNTQRITSSQDGLANVMLHQGELSAGLNRLEAAARTWRDIGNYQGLMKTYVRLASGYTWQAKYTKSDQICLEALELQERTGDLNWASNISYYLGLNALRRGKFSRAFARFVTASQTAQQLGNSTWEAMGQAGQSMVHLALGQFDDAQTKAKQAEKLAQATGAALWLARVRRVLARVAAVTGTPSIACDILQEQLPAMQQTGLALDQVEIFIDLLTNYIRLERWDEAATLHPHLNALVVSSDLPAHRVHALGISARLAEHNQQLQKALGLSIQAEKLAAELHYRLGQLEMELLSVHLLQALHHNNQASTRLQQARAHFEAIADALTDADMRAAFLSRGPLSRQFHLLEPT